MIRKNPNDVSSLGRINIFLIGILIVVSSVSFGTNVFFNTNNCKRININKWARGNLNDYASVKGSFSRHNDYILGCWRVRRRYFCSVSNVDTTSIDLSKAIDTGYFSILTDNTVSEGKTKKSITDKDLSKEIISYSSSRSIIDKLSTFKIDVCGKYINITKEFLCDPMFLKFAYYLIINSKGVHRQLDGINDK